MLLAVTLLADLNRLNVSWQVMPLPYPSTPAHVLPLLLLLLPFPYPRTLCRIMSVSVGSGASRRRHRGVCFGSFACPSNNVYYGAGRACEMACACVTRSRRT